MKTLLGDEVISLRALTISDISGNYSNWFNDPEIVEHNSHGRFPMTKEKLETYVASIDLNTSLIVLAVIMRKTGVHIGNISLQKINWIDRNAEIAFILGEIDHQSKGVMMRAGKLLINHAFNQLNLHRVYCGTLDTNFGMKRLAIKLGMQEEGRRLEAVYKNGSYVDILEYGITKTKNIKINATGKLGSE